MWDIDIGSVFLMNIGKEATILRRDKVGSEKFENSRCSNSSNLPEPTLSRLKIVALSSLWVNCKGMLGVYPTVFYLSL